MSYGFCSKFHTLFSSGKNFENRIRFDKVAESLKVGTFFETQCSCSSNFTFSSGKHHCTAAAYAENYNEQVELTILAERHTMRIQVWSTCQFQQDSLLQSTSKQIDCLSKPISARQIENGLPH